MANSHIVDDFSTDYSTDYTPVSTSASLPTAGVSLGDVYYAQDTLVAYQVNSVPDLINDSGSIYPEDWTYHNSVSWENIGTIPDPNSVGTSLKIRGLEIDTSTGGPIDGIFKIGNWHVQANGAATEAGAWAWYKNGSYYMNIEELVALSSNNDGGAAATAGTSDALSTARTITFAGGDVEGNFSFDGSADVNNIILNIPYINYEEGNNVADFVNNDITTTGEVLQNYVGIYEQANTSGPTAVSGRGYLWIENSTPQKLWFRDDQGTDTRLV